MHSQLTQYTLNLHSTPSTYTVHSQLTQYALNLRSTPSTYTVHPQHMQYTLNICSTHSTYAVHTQCTHIQHPSIHSVHFTTISHACIRYICICTYIDNHVCNVCMLACVDCAYEVTRLQKTDKSDQLWRKPRAAACGLTKDFLVTLHPQLTQGMYHTSPVADRRLEGASP